MSTFIRARLNTSHVRQSSARIVLCGFVGLALFTSGSTTGPDVVLAVARRDVAWDVGNVEAAGNAANRRGRNPVYASVPATNIVGVVRQGLEGDGNAFPAEPGRLEDDGGAVGGNFELAVPVIAVPGRGLDTVLTLYYHSRIWAEVGGGFIFDPDADWPAPGWTLGFGKLTRDLLIDADGTRHLLQQLDSTRSQTTDGAGIDVEWASDRSAARVRYDDGRSIEFGALLGTTLYPRTIMDRHGNFISLAYQTVASYPVLSGIVDTVGRVYQLHYDSTGRLITITGPNLANGTREIARFHYKHVNTQVLTWDAVTNRRVSVPIDADFIDAVYFPGTRSGLWLGDADSYHRWGMVETVKWQTDMSIQNASLTTQGDIRQGRSIRSRTYPFARPSVMRSVPVYRSMAETWAGGPSPATTTYSFARTGSLRQTTVVYPDGMRVIQTADETPGRVDAGLVNLITVFDASGRSVQNQVMRWEQGADGVPRVRRVEYHNEEIRAVSAVEYEYGPHNAITEARYFNYDGSLRRRIKTEYVGDPRYEARHIFQLPMIVSVFEGTSTVPASRVEYFYDQFPLIAPSPRDPQHSDTDPLRGNVTTIVTYANAAQGSGPIEERRTYDVFGNLVTSARSGSGATTRMTYTAQTGYAFPEVVATGPDNGTALMSERKSWNRNLGVLTAVTNANGSTTGYEYDPSTLRLSAIRPGTGGIVRFTVENADLTRIERVEGAGGEVIRTTSRLLDGRGRTRQVTVFGDATAPATAWQMEYDLIGRQSRTSQPYRIGDTARWVTHQYDALGRPAGSRLPDGSQYRTSFNETRRPSDASGQPGITQRNTDPWGRERWFRYDIDGNLAEVVEPNPAGTGGVNASGNLATRYQYNSRGQLTRVEQGAQTRAFVYDSVGRLLRQRLPEKTASLNELGSCVAGGSGSWTDVISYDARTGQIASVTDARGVRTRYDYGTDPLGRLQAVSYDMTGFCDRSHPVAAVGPTTFDYMTTGDVRRVRARRSAGIAEEEFGYDGQGRLSSVRTTLKEFSANALSLDYGYDAIGRPAFVRYPAQWGLPGAARRTVTYAYRAANRLDRVDLGNGGWSLSDIQYAPNGQPSTFTISQTTAGATPRGVVSTRTYDPNTLFLRNQSVIARPGGAAVLDTGTEYALSPDAGLLGPENGTPAVSGQLAAQTDARPRENRAYRYDAIGRLSEARIGITQSGPAGQPKVSFESLQQYGYDRYGNRTRVRATGPPAAVGCPPRQQCLGPDLRAEQHDGWPELLVDERTNQIISAGFAYDANGNTVSARRPDGSTHEYQYDAANRLVAVHAAGSALLERYVYAYDRRRIGVFDAKNRGTVYAWSGSDVVAEYSAASNQALRWTKTTVRQGGLPVASFAVGSGNEILTDIHLNDPLGTRAQMRADSQSAVLTPRWVEALPFGRDFPGEPPTDARFSQYARSAATGLDYATNRTYDPMLGRFLEADPIGLLGSRLNDPQTLNLYVYSGNDPVNRSDPSGLMPPQVPYPGPCREDEMWIHGQGCTEIVVVVGKAPDLGFVSRLQESGLDIETSRGSEVEGVIDKRLGEILRETLELEDSAEEAMAEQVRKTQRCSAIRRERSALFEKRVTTARSDIREMATLAGAGNAGLAFAAVLEVVPRILPPAVALAIGVSVATGYATTPGLVTLAHFDEVTRQIDRGDCPMVW